MTTRKQRTEEFSRKLTALTLLIRDKAMAQFLYNEDTNIPAKIIQPEESTDFALRHGVAAAINKEGGWCCENAIAYATEILEDANCHTEVRKLTGETA